MIKRNERRRASDMKRWNLRQRSAYMQRAGISPNTLAPTVKQLRHTDDAGTEYVDPQWDNTRWAGVKVGV